MSVGAILRFKKLTGSGIVRTAAAHNKRTIQAELGAGGSIDARLTGLNEVLAGPLKPDDVADRARARMAGAGVGKLRKDAVRALEFVASLAPGQCADERGFFAAAAHWLADKFGADNILSADVHRDEAAPHLHVLVLPLIGGRMAGSDAVAPPQWMTLQKEFFEAVCVPFGLKRYPRRLVGTSKTATFAAVLAEVKRRNDPVLTSALWPLLRDRIEATPGPFAELLGLEAISASKPKKLRSMTAIFTSKGKGSQKPESDEPYKGLNDRTLYLCKGSQNSSVSNVATTTPV
ncbi:plasmid recombination protein [Paucibacter sp. hw8]|uniref:Plasmid recombination protein n=1 Tax=Roseateles albus TaxID=2987525 RepID=A0ABT5K9M9_9BURK|nr:plasmid recombination protein [Roseateles albus]